jgi:hypothetical protein
MTCEDFVCFKQAMPYNLKKMGSFFKALKFMTPFVKIFMCWILGLNLLEDPNINSLYLPLSYPLFNPILSLIYLFIMDSGYDGKWPKAKESGSGPWCEKKMTQNKTQGTSNPNCANRCLIIINPSPTLFVHLMLTLCVVVSHQQEVATFLT